jgi:uncharacterized protein YoxC
MSPLSILLLVLVAAGVWAVVELALTLRKARTTLDEVSHSATEAIDQATPVIAKLDGVVDELQPALREVTPIVEKLGETMDEANTSLNRVNGILGDVSSATHGVSSVGESASRILDTATSAAVGVVSKVASFGGITIPEGQQLIGKGTPEQQEVEPVAEKAPEAPARKAGYVTYAPVAQASDEE